MGKFRLCLFFILVLFAAAIKAQQLSLTHYSIKDGLINDEIRGIWQDKKGLIWIATTNGFSIYDGRKFSNFSTRQGLPHPLVTNFFLLPNDEVLIGTGDTVAAAIYHQKNIIQIPYSDQFPHINDIFQKDDYSYLSTNKGLLYYQGNRFIEQINYAVFAQKPILLKEPIYPLLEWQDSILLISRPWLSSIQFVNTKNGYKPITAEIKFEDNIGIVGGLVDQQKRIWIGTQKGLKLIDGNSINTEKIIFLPVPEGLQKIKVDYINNLLKDENNNIWISTIAEGLIKYQPDGAVKQYTIQTDEGENCNVRILFEDKEHILWIGTNHGVFKLVNKNTEYYNSTSLKGINYINDIIENKYDKSIWVAHSDGLAIISKQKIENYPFQKNTAIGTNDVEDLLIDGKYIWMLMLDPWTRRNKLIKIDAQKTSLTNLKIEQQFNFSSLSGPLFRMQKDRNGALFLGSKDGKLQLLYKDKICTLRGAIPSIDAPIMQLDHNNNLWVGGWTKGVYEFSLTYYADSVVAHLLHTFHIKNLNTIRSSATDAKGNIWFGTRTNGLFNLQLNSRQQITAIKNYTIADGLSDNWIRTLTAANANQFWIGTGSGLDKLKTTDDAAFIESTGKQHNIISNIISICEAADGHLWLAANSSAIRLTPEKDDNPPFPVVFTSLRVYGKTDTTFEPATARLDLKYDQSAMDVEFALPSYKNEKAIQYSYFLEGSSHNWSDPSYNNIVRLSHLSPGSYVFKVKVMKPNGEWDNRTALFNFIVHPPFWKTWWFYGILVLLFIFLLYTIYQNRIQQLLKLQAIRNRISQDLHDDLGATLSSVSLLSDVAREKMAKGDYQQSNGLLAKISEYSREMVEKMGDIVWSVNPENDSLQDMIYRLRSFAVDVCVSKNIELFFPVDVAVKDYSLSLTQRRNIYLICKEAINNAVKHALCNTLTVEIKTTSKQLSVLVKDNGKGMDMTTTFNGNGLHNIDKRAKEINAVLNINSCSAGTDVLFNVPLP